MVKRNHSDKATKEKFPAGQLLNLFILFLILINLYLLFSFVAKIIPVFNKSEELQNDTLKTKVQVEVLNGCGISGTAELLTAYLRTNGFDVVNMGNYRSFEIENSIVIDRTGKIENAKRVASLIGMDISNVIQQVNDEYLLDVTLILGKDYSQLTPLKKRS